MPFKTMDTGLCLSFQHAIITLFEYHHLLLGFFTKITDYVMSHSMQFIFPVMCFIIHKVDKNIKFYATIQYGCILYGDLSWHAY